MIVLLIIILLLDSIFYNSLRKGRITVKRRVKLVLLSLAILHTFIILLLFIRVIFYKGYFEDNSHLANFLDISFMFSIGLIPKIIIALSSNIAARISKFRRVSRVIFMGGRILALVTIILVLTGTLYGRFNFRIERVEIEIDGLADELKGLKIVQISDMHLSSFHRNSQKLKRAISMINSLKPDILVNTGDYVSFGYREMEPFIEILSGAQGKNGSFAILGNHDMGTYHPDWDKNERELNVKQMSDLIRQTGYKLLRDQNSVIKIGNSFVSIIGVETYGSIPNISYGDLKKASEGSDTTDLRLLLSHDPNHWTFNRESVENIELTLSGHTHGMQLGILLGALSFSPASLIFPSWYGLYGSDNNFLYVNRGLGVLGFPFRIGMPPEITEITIK